jgi:hypothetical protein
MARGLLDPKTPLIYGAPTVRLSAIFFCFLILPLSSVALAQEEVPPPNEENELPPGFTPEEEPVDPFSEPDLPADPARIVWSAGAGVSIRFLRNLDFSQDWPAPGFVDAFGAFVFPGHAVRHGVGLNASINLSGDGSLDLGVDPAQQIVVAPTYLLYIGLSELFKLSGKVSVPLVVTPDFSFGAELAVGAHLFVLAGFGFYAELSATMFFGADSTVHPFGSVEGGLSFDYEVLP